jgi:outer membrane protein OmpA-like peptidoglycan-associated protein
VNIRSIYLALVALALVAACSRPQEVVVVETTGDEEPPPPPAEPVAEADPEDVHLEGDHVTIDRMIHFATDSDQILDDSTEILDHIALFLSHHTAEVASLQVIGHTDRHGNAAHNQDLSTRRAAAVVAALQSRGVTQALESSGLGSTRPLCPERSEECDERNRRVEFVVVGQ